MNAPSLRGLAGRPGERAVEEVEDAAEDDEDAREEPQLGGGDDGGDDRDAEADQGQGVRGEADLAHRDRDRRRDAADAGAEVRARRRSRGGAPGRVGEPGRGRSLAAGERLEGVAAEPAERLAAVAACLDEARGTKPADVPADERLREADLADRAR